MADNIDITPGTGKTIATDDCSTGHAQIIKLAYSADGDRTLVQADANGLLVSMRRDTQRIAVQSGGLTTATTNYTAGDQCGTQFTFANAARSSGGSGRITGITLINATDNGAAYDLVVTDSSITLASDNAAYAISDSDALKIVSLIPLASAYDIGNNRIALAQNINIPYVCSGGTSLYGGLIIRSSGFFFGAATDITIVMYVERD